MKSTHSLLLLGLVIGIAIGWVANSSLSPDKPAPESAESDSATRGKSGRQGKSSSLILNSGPGRINRWMPEDEDAFMTPQSEADHATIQRLMRAAIEKEHQFPARMKAVSDLLALMTPENAHDLRDAFMASWNDGFNYNWERSLFFGRYGEVMGKEGAEEFLDHKEFERLLVSWTQHTPKDAVDWVNELPPGSKRDKAINRVMFGAGQVNPEYGLQVFQSLAPEDQARNRGDLFESFRRARGAESCIKLVENVFSSDDEELRKHGPYVLQRTFDLINDWNKDALPGWLNSLPPEQFGLIDPSRLPAGFQASPAESPGTRPAGPGAAGP